MTEEKRRTKVGKKETEKVSNRSLPVTYYRIDFAARFQITKETIGELLVIEESRFFYGTLARKSARAFL